MIVTPIKTRKVTAGACTINELIDESVTQLPEKSIVACSSKVVALCEGRVQPIENTDTDFDKLYTQEADYYLPTTFGKYGFHFTITRNTFIASAGIDKSNGNGFYVLWPKDLQQSANNIRHYVQERFGRREIGVVITDSASVPLRLGTIGVAIAYSGFAPVNSYIGKPDLFGRVLKINRANIASGLAAAANLVMGEGSECTPIVVVQDSPQLTFLDHDPTPAELATFANSLQDDLYAPLFTQAPWQKGGGGA